MGVKPLPSDLNEAIRVMESSDLVAEDLGKHVFDFSSATSARDGTSTAARSAATK